MQTVLSPKELGPDIKPSSFVVVLAVRDSLCRGFNGHSWFSENSSEPSLSVPFSSSYLSLSSASQHKILFFSFSFKILRVVLFLCNCQLNPSSAGDEMKPPNFVPSEWGCFFVLCLALSVFPQPGFPLSPVSLLFLCTPSAGFIGSLYLTCSICLTVAVLKNTHTPMAPYFIQ